MLDDDQKSSLVSDLLEFVHLTVEQTREGKASEGQMQAMAYVSQALLMEPIASGQPD